MFLCSVRLLHPYPMRLRPLRAQWLADAASAYQPGRADEGIQPKQTLVWGGLREWCYITNRSLVVEADLAEAILAQFGAADPGRPRIRALNAVMIKWLVRCRSNRWHLIAEEEPLLDALERELRAETDVVAPVQ